jgi:hypothetical protein
MVTMELDFNGQLITSADFGYTIALTISGGYEVLIENDFSIRSPAGDEFSISPGVDTETSTRHLQELTTHTITSALAEKSGTLHLTFTNGAHLQVPPNDMFEAWTVAGPNGLKIVCMPNGELATWTPQTGQP